MRIRTLKPSFFTDEDIAELQPLCRLLFQGLWLAADSAGRLKDRPKKIKVEILPYDDVDIDEMLDLLDKKGFIIRYEVDGIACIQVRTFLKHQRLSGKEAALKSELPEPPKDREATGKQQGSNGEAPGTNLERTGEATGKHPESLEGKGRERKGESNARARVYSTNSDPPDPEPPKPELSVLAEHSWQEFRALMPLRSGKFLDEDAVREKWRRSPAMWPQWLAAVKNYRESREVRDCIVCAPTTFLVRKWRDFETPETPLGDASGLPPADYSWKKEIAEFEQLRNEGRLDPIPPRPEFLRQKADGGAG